MIFWENWAGLLLALFITAQSKPKAFAAAIALYFAATMLMDFYLFGIDGNPVVRLSVLEASTVQHWLKLKDFAFSLVWLILMVLVNDRDPMRSLVRLFYLAFVGLKASMGTFHAAAIEADQSLESVQLFIENSSILFDVIVLVVGTDNRISRWTTKERLLKWIHASKKLRWNLRG